MNILLSGDWILSALAKIFVMFFDWVAYNLLVVSYNIFDGVSQLDLFGGSDAGQTFYNSITKNVYVVLSIVMVFMFAYQLLMLIADPDSKAKGATGALVKDTIISIVLLITLPLVYKYMAIFQYHVLNNGTIPAIIMGVNAPDSDHNPGQNVAIMTYVSFYHPEGASYTTFFDESGDLRDEATAIDECDDNAEKKVCELYYEALENWDDSDGGLGNLTAKTKLHGYINEDAGMVYYWFLATAAGLAAAYFFFCYAFDVGIRAVKLGVLELISPIPVVLKIFPKTRKSFDNWFRVIKKTYLELFVRVAVIFFGIELIKLIPTFITILKDSNNAICASTFTQCVATVILILSILGFAKQAPQLFKEVFDMGGDLFKGLDLKPGFKRRLHDDTVIAHKPISAIGGGVGQFATQFRENYKPGADKQGSILNGAKAAVGAMPMALRGVVSGFTTKQDDNQKLSEAFNSGVGTARTHVAESDRLKRKSKSIADVIQGNKTFGQSIVEGWSKNTENGNLALVHKKKENMQKNGHKYMDFLSSNESTNETVENINAANATIENLLGLAGSTGEAYDKAWADIQKEIIKKGSYTYAGTSYTAANQDQLKELIEGQKNAAIAKKVSDYQDTSAKTYMKQYMEKLTKAVSSMSEQQQKDADARINSKIDFSKISTSSGDTIKNVMDLANQMSKGNVNIDANVISALNTIESTYKIEKNKIVSEEKAKKSETPPTKNNGGKPS